MTTLSEISDSLLRSQLSSGKFLLQVGPYSYCIKSKEPGILEGLRVLYNDFKLADPNKFIDFNIALEGRGLINRITRKTEFFFDDRTPFNRIEAHHAYAFLEWGMNWCVSVYANEYLKLHSAVLEKDGKALILPGLPGAGKSTLSAALTLNGWRLLSDEHALIQLDTASVVPLCRPVSLKNESIDIIKAYDSRAVFGKSSEKTHKGTVAHMKADLYANSHDITPIPARWMIFPEYCADTKLTVSPKPKVASFMFAAMHSFNYSLLASRGFHALSKLMDSVDCFDIKYNDLEQSLSAIDTIVAEQ